MLKRLKKELPGSEVRAQLKAVELILIPRYQNWDWTGMRSTATTFSCLQLALCWNGALLNYIEGME
jgi:hypothetical protein